MKTVFVVNPKAGKGKGTETLIDAIYDAAKSQGKGAFVYETKAVRDAERFTAAYLKANPEEEIRLYACGGDGTMNEVLNSVIEYQKATGHKNVAIGLVPIGSGNDFVKNFGKVGDALDLVAQLKAVPENCDALRIEGKIDGKETVRYCANMLNIGFDCNTADLAGRMKKIPLISGPIAYLLSVLTMLIQKKGANLQIQVDGETVHEGPLLLNSIANGPYCGGGIMSNPTATIHDGLMDLNVVNDVSRLKFINLLPKYMKGTHMSMKGIDKIITTYVAKETIVTPLGGPMRLCTDGEITDAGKIKVTVEQDAFKFLVPQS